MNSNASEITICQKLPYVGLCIILICHKFNTLEIPICWNSKMLEFQNIGILILLIHWNFQYIGKSNISQFKYIRLAIALHSSILEEQYILEILMHWKFQSITNSNTSEILTILICQKSFKCYQKCCTRFTLHYTNMNTLLYQKKTYILLREMHFSSRIMLHLWKYTTLLPKLHCDTRIILFC